MNPKVTYNVWRLASLIYYYGINRTKKYKQFPRPLTEGRRCPRVFIPVLRFASLTDLHYLATVSRDDVTVRALNSKQLISPVPGGILLMNNKAPYEGQRTQDILPLKYEVRAGGRELFFFCMFSG